MQKNWDSRLIYHNLIHTMQVLQASQEIAGALRLLPSELEVVELAAWFHDVGYNHCLFRHYLGSLHNRENAQASRQKKGKTQRKTK